MSTAEAVFIIAALGFAALGIASVLGRWFRTDAAVLRWLDAVGYVCALTAFSSIIWMIILDIF